MDKELIKKIIGGPRFWLIVVPLAALWLIVFTTLYPRYADGATPQTEPATICPAGEWDCYTAERFADDFDDGKLGNSEGIEFSPRVKKMIKKAARTAQMSLGRGMDRG